MSVKSMMTLKELLCKELDGYAMGGPMSGNALTEIHMLTDTIKNIDKIMMMDEQSSFDGRSMRGGSYGGSYGDGYARVSRTSGRGSYGRSYSGEVSSRRGGRYSYGDDNQPAIEKLEDLLNEGDMSQEEETIVRRAMDMLKK